MEQNKRKKVHKNILMIVTMIDFFVFLVQYSPCGRKKCAFKGHAHGRQQ